MKRKRNQVLLVKVSAAEKSALFKFAAAQDVPAAQLIRHALRRVLAEGQASQ
jgi:hypothetical protein